MANSCFLHLGYGVDIGAPFIDIAGSAQPGSWRCGVFCERAPRQGGKVFVVI